MDSGRSGGRGSALLTVLLLAWMAVAGTSPVQSDTQRILEYEYDEAGNITAVRTGLNLGPPDVTEIQPAFVNINSFNTLTATGVNLAGATVETTTPGLSILNYTVLSETKITLTLRADDSATTGPGELLFTTRLGEDSESIAIAERTPVISTEPNPVILSPNGTGVFVRLIFDQPFDTDQIYDIAITDTAIASVDRQTMTLFAGETETTVTVTGLQVGNTILEINQLSNFLALGIPVYVNEAQLPDGEHLFSSEPLGISIYTGPESHAGTGVFHTPHPLGVSIYTGPVPHTGTGIFYTPNPLGTAYGTTVGQTSPESISQGTSATLTLEGTELDSVTAVGFDLADGITQSGAFAVTADGTQMTIPIEVASTASTGIRVIILTTPSGDLMFSEGVFLITN